ncbi:MAG: SPOR domain-containing protein [Treponema sp.]|jgi:hypothetical protein|nr:SPOR domain-containing protein [Treponema sp.]
MFRVLFRALAFCAILAVFPGFVRAQSSNAASQGAPMGTEIQNIEKNLGKSGLSGAGRRDLLIRLAQIQELTGNIEAAAQNWAAAAAAEPGKRDDLSLIRGAFCLAAMGEWDRAGAAAKTILLTGQAGPALLLARYLGAQVEAFGSGDLAALTALADDPGFVSLRPAIYYTLWNISKAAPEGPERWKNRLITEFPRSPEGRIAAGGGGAVDILPSPLWLFFPGRGGIALETAAPPGTSAPAVSASVPAASPASGQGVLQTGLFGSEANARKQAERLQAAGFTPALGKRRINETDYWTVNVPPGQNMGQTILKLKDAGFEAFPVF